MAWIILGLFLLATIVGFIIDFNMKDCAFTIFTIPIFIICALVVLWCFASNYIDYVSSTDKIIVAEETNKALEDEIAQSVKTYMTYEGEEFKSLKPDYNSADLIAFAESYPKLNSSKLISEQIKVYQNNKKEIKKYKIEQIKTRNILKIWYFVNKSGN